MTLAVRMNKIIRVFNDNDIYPVSNLWIKQYLNETENITFTTANTLQNSSSSFFLISEKLKKRILALPISTFLIFYFNYIFFK